MKGSALSWCKNNSAKLCKKILQLRNWQNKNTVRYPMTNLFLLALFPVFLVCMSELTVNKYPSKLVLFIAEHPGIMLFDVLLMASIFWGLMLILRRGFIAMLIQSIAVMTMSIAELFKYGTNGNHLMMPDMILTGNIVALKGFAYIKITTRLVITVLIVLGYLAAAFIMNPKIGKKIKFPVRIVSGIASLSICVLLIVLPNVSQPIYRFFGIDTKPADNTFILNEKYDNNSFIAFFMQTGSEGFSSKLAEPENYEENSGSAIDPYLSEPEKREDHFKNGKPNVIVIMSESFADFRVFDELKDVIGNTYDGLDEAADMGYQGMAIAPTYASYTVRTEFELMFGLPVKSLDDPSMPNRVLLDRPQPTVPAYYKAWGYNTAYVHPYISSFYGRNRIYANFGYDAMIFDTDFTVPVKYFGTYIDDNTILQQIETMLKESEEPMFIHTTTMQNHQPYTQGDGDEFDNYLEWVKHSSDELSDFLKRMEKFDEPTVVLFIGDHFPSLRGDDGIYAQLGITSENCAALYEQKYILWNNCGLNESILPEEKISVFYLPYVVMEWIDAPRDAFTQTMIDEMMVTPIYSTNYNPKQESNEKLDALTYDHILGDIVSPSALDILGGKKTAAEVEAEKK
ncbi:MAG: sulfatase-like hydrolase/transferase [Ruminococcus sp.]|nr:sulfatase-like hydrolase/transferase [Ruminococcus sp.]